MRKLSICLLVAILGGALLAGCGSSNTQKTETITSSRSSEAPGGTTSGTGATGTEPTPKTAQQKVEACKHNVGTLSTLSASTKARLLKACEKVGTSVAEQRKVVHQVCQELAGRLPAGLARERALAICRVAP